MAKRAEKTPIKVESVFPKRRQEIFAENSWGYKDSFYYYNDKEKRLYFQGKRCEKF